jgi:hopanoid-associated phosphorylase
MRILPTAVCATGLAVEARLARAAGFPAIIGGGDHHRTASLVEESVQRAHCLVSFGVAGALAPGLRPGDVILSGEVVTQDRRWRPESEFHHRILDLAWQVGAFVGPVMGSRTILATEEAKMAAWRETGALAADMESAAVAEAAEAAGIPFLVLRAIADPATRTLPPAALIPLAEDGTPALARVVAEVLRRPRQLPALVGVARETRRALAALVRPARALHGMLGAGG